MVRPSRPNSCATELCSACTSPSTKYAHQIRFKTNPPCFLLACCRRTCPGVIPWRRVKQVWICVQHLLQSKQVLLRGHKYIIGHIEILKAASPEEGEEVRILSQGDARHIPCFRDVHLPERPDQTSEIEREPFPPSAERGRPRALTYVGCQLQDRSFWGVMAYWYHMSHAPPTSVAHRSHRTLVSQPPPTQNLCGS